MRVLLAAAAVAALAAPVFADGKFFVLEKLPPEIPYQRAALFFTGDREMLVVQSKYSFPGGDAPAEADWVVPVPAEPEVAALDADLGTYFFDRFDLPSSPRVRRYGWVVEISVWCALVALVIVLGWRWKHLGTALSLFVTGSVLIGMVTLTIPMGRRGVEVLRDEIAGAYHVRVVAATDAGELAKWLGEAGFATTEKDRAALAAYVAKGWCFATAKLRKEEAGKAKLEPEGLAPPLILAFAAKAPVYPLALTATAGGETEIVLWVVAPHRVEGGPLPTRFARAADEELYGAWLMRNWAGARTPPILADPAWAQPWLTKLKGRLTPAQMAEDLVLPYAPADEAMRETVWVW